MDFLKIINETEREFETIAHMLFDNFAIQTHTALYRFIEIEFYWNSPNHVDNSTYQRKYVNPKSGDWFFHYSGVDIALKNDQANYKAWHVLGRWNYEISNLSFIEKAAVNIFFGGVPKATFADAVKSFEKAKNISPGFVINYFEMARAYKKTDQMDKAIASLNTLLQLPNTTEDDEAAKNNARKLLKEWK